MKANQMGSKKSSAVKKTANRPYQGEADKVVLAKAKEILLEGSYTEIEVLGPHEVIVR